MDDVIEIRIPAKPRYLRVVRGAVSDFCELAGLSSKESNLVRLAIDEACTNIIRHAYGGETSQPIIMTVRILPDRIRFIMHDHGRHVNPKQLKSRALSEIRPGGLGVHLIKSVMDLFVYQERDGMNELILEKNIKVK